MHSEMHTPEVPPMEHFKLTLDARLRIEVARQKRAIFPSAVTGLVHHLRSLIKPLLQSGAMAMTAIVVIIAISATPAATTGDNEIPRAAPLAAPDVRTLVDSDSTFRDFLPADDVLAVQKPDNSDIAYLGME
ncbi:MAG TPA: hypothetical protein VIW94_04895 [Acidimicrobiia bacterium]